MPEHDRTPGRVPDPLREHDRTLGLLILAAGAALTALERLRRR